MASPYGYNNGLGTFNDGSNALSTQDALVELQKLLNDEQQLRAQAEAELLENRLNNTKKIIEQEIEARKAQYRVVAAIGKKELEAEIKADEAAGKKRSKQELKERKNLLDKLTKLEVDAAKAAEKIIAKETLKARAKTIDEINKLYSKNGEFGSGLSAKERKAAKIGALVESGAFADAESAAKALKGAQVKAGIAASLEALGKAGDFAAQLDSMIDSIASNKSAIDTRLQGSKNKTKSGSYWEKISANVTGIAGVSPILKQETLVANVRNLVSRGIAFDVEQRAFLQTISEKIATTFDIADSSLIKLVRIQQADTSAARLGMEASLNAFLNNMYETTEYMTDAAKEIRSNLYEASALMTAKSATEFEYQVQKWMGSLYSVGMSQSAVQGISGALGKLAAGQIEGITGDSFGNLLVMAANRSGQSLAGILKNGLNADATNNLLGALTTYLADIYDSTSGNNVVAQQYAKVFGISASDLKAAKNLQKSTGSIYGSNLGYGGMLSKLVGMSNTMYQRTSLGELLNNAFSNLKYSTAAGVANSPALYSIYKVGKLLKDTTGGIDIPLPLVLGNGVNMGLNVADLMLVGAMSGGLLSSLGKMIGAGNLGGINATNGAGLLNSAGINLTGVNTVVRGGKESVLSVGGWTQSESGYSSYVGNSEGGDVYNKTLGDAKNENNKTVAEAIDESEETTLNTVDEHVVGIYELLQDVINGTSALHISFGEPTTWTLPGNAGGLG